MRGLSASPLHSADRAPSLPPSDLFSTRSTLVHVSRRCFASLHVSRVVMYNPTVESKPRRRKQGDDCHGKSTKRIMDSRLHRHPGLLAPYRLSLSTDPSRYSSPCPKRGGADFGTIANPHRLTPPNAHAQANRADGHPNEHPGAPPSHATARGVGLQRTGHHLAGRCGRAIHRTRHPSGPGQLLRAQRK